LPEKEAGFDSLVIYGKVVFLSPSFGGVRGGFSFKVLWHVGKKLMSQIIRNTITQVKK
jgi:hypothetical protein